MKKEKTHWLQSPNKNFFGHWDLPSGKDLTLTIKSAAWEEVKNPVINKSEAKRVIRFFEDVKPLIVNQTNAQSIVDATNIKWLEDSVGAKITLFLDSIKDRRTGQTIDCVRIRSKTAAQEKKLLTKEMVKTFTNAILVYKQEQNFAKIEARYKLTDAVKKEIKDAAKVS